MFGKVSDDSFQNIFDLSFESEDNSKCVNHGSQSLDFLSPLSSSPLNSYINNNNNKNEVSFSQSLRESLLNTHPDELEQAFAKLYTSQKDSIPSQDTFASSFFPFSLNSHTSEKSKLSDLIDESYRKKLSAALAVGSQSGSSASSTCSSVSISSPNSCSGSLPASKVNTSRYKTELCRPYQENGSCKYGEKCQFAHGMVELRTVNRHPKYKTDLCKTYHSVGFCPYGPRCHFIHSLEELASCQSPTTSTPATPNDIAAAIAALRQLPIFSPERIAPPPGFGPIKSRRNLDSLGLSSIASSESSGFNSATSLSPNLDSDLEDSKSRLTVFSRFSH